MGLVAQPNSVDKVAPRGCLSLFFAVFFTLGAVMTIFIVRQAWSELKVYSWTPVSATIVQSEVIAAPSDTSGPVWHLAYRFNLKGAVGESHRYRVSSVETAEAAEVYRWAARFPRGATRVAYAGPGSPSDAVLVREIPWGAAFLIVPLFFAGIGAVGIYYIWQPTVGGPVTNQPTRSMNRLAKVGGLIFFTIFLGVGVFTSLPLLIRPAQLYFSSRTWVYTPCEIVASRVRTYSGDDTTYAPEIVYRYRFQGQTYTAARFKLYAGSSSGYRDKQATVRTWYPGWLTTCLVDPNDPTNAVLDRSGSPLWLLGLVPLVFASVGLAGICKMWASPAPLETTGSVPAFSQTQTSPRVEAPPDGWRVPAVSRRARAGSLVFFALLWNSAVFFIGYNIYRDHSGRISYVGLLFLVPFLVAGIFLLVRALREAANVKSPEPKMRLTPPAAVLGGALAIEWGLTGRIDRLESIAFSLVAEESATYSRGTTSSTDKRVFYEQKLSSGESGSAGGRISVTIPAETMPTFSARHNRITWSIRAETKVRYRPSIQDDFEFIVQPRALAPDYA